LKGGEPLIALVTVALIMTYVLPEIGGSGAVPLVP